MESRLTSGFRETGNLTPACDIGIPTAEQRILNLRVFAAFHEGSKGRKLAI